MKAINSLLIFISFCMAGWNYANHLDLWTIFWCGWMIMLFTMRKHLR